MSEVRILVNGGAGYIGSHVLVDLLAEGHSFLSIDSFRNSRPEIYDAVMSIAGRRLDHAQLDLCDTEHLRAVVARFRPESAIHLAGHVAELVEVRGRPSSAEVKLPFCPDRTSPVGGAWSM